MASWPWQFLGKRYHPVRGDLNPPTRWPNYRLNPHARMSSTDRVPQTGFYLPLLDETSPQFFIAGKKPVNALVGLDDQGMQYARKQAADWVLIERVPGEYVDDPLKNVLPSNLKSHY